LEENTNLNKHNLQYYLNHSKIDVLFKQNKDDFVVTEIPLYDFAGEGEHIVVKLRKKDLSTWDALQIIADSIGCKLRDIGYAGLKDKNAMTIQHISIPKQFEEKINSFAHENIKFLETVNHNKFIIRLKRVSPMDSKKIEQALGKIATYGIPNYFGVQRFGAFGDNHEKGQQIVEGTLKEKRRNLKQMYLNAYQSFLFNSWLSKRVEISKLIEAFEPKEICEKVGLPQDIVKQMKAQEHPFKMLPGELMSHYPFGKIFIAEELDVESDKFYKKDRVPTGLLPGKRVKISEGLAQEFEKDFDKKTFEDGARRFAWVFPDEIESNYKEDKNWFELSFTLPKGSYATQVISEIIH
jgi:tRNA pseudouridine13 synthase